MALTLYDGALPDATAPPRSLNGLRIYEPAPNPLRLFRVGDVRTGTAMLAYQMLRLAIQTLSAVFGGVGVFAVYASFYVPGAGSNAILMLGLATAMVYALEQPARRS